MEPQARDTPPRPTGDAQSLRDSPSGGSGETADRYLVEEIRNGSGSAWRQFINRYEGRLLAFARSRIARAADAEDLVQETFVGFVQSLDSYDQHRDLESYLFSILRHKLYDLLRRQKVTPLNAPPDGDDWWDRVRPGREVTPSGHAANIEARQVRRQTLAEVLKHYINDCRDRGAFHDLQVIELLFFAGKRNLEVAELLGMDQKAVAGVKFRAVQRLRKYLEDMDADDPWPEVDEAHAEVTVARVWREKRLTCLKRSTLGSHLLGVLDEPWLSYTQFHLDVVGCPLCLANLADLQEDETGAPRPLTESIFASSIGFLSRASSGGEPDQVDRV